MSGNVDERIVGMKFDNKQFEDGAKTSMSTMDKLKASLNFDGAKKGLSDLGTTAAGLNLGDKIGAGVEGLGAKFSALEVVAFGALANIGAKAVDMGLQMAKSLTIDPIKAGFDEYELKLGSIQTILANTSKYGTSLQDVNSALNDLNKYADKTIYNFGDMTKNIGLFTNAGIGIQDATAMIKGFSNEAAASGTSAEGAAGAAYQLSQALSRGKITLQDWNSLANAGMGNANMKDGLIQIASAMGTFNDNTTTAANAQADFNGTLEKGWLSSDVMSTYLKIQAGELSATEQATLGLSDTQITAFAKQQKIAEDAATKVRTFSGLVGTLREAVGSSWTDTFEIIIGNFDEATALFTNISNSLGGVIGNIGEARNKMLQGWKDLGGRQDLLDIGKNLFDSIKNIVAPIQQAWAKIFPADGGQGLKGFTGALKTVTDVIVNITSGLSKLQPVFEVIFGLFKIGYDVVKGLLSVFINLFAIFGGVGVGGVTGLVGGFAALIAKVTEFVNQGKLIDKFFSGIRAAQMAVLKPMLDFFTRIADAFKLLASGDTSGFFDGIKGSVAAFAPLVDIVSAKMEAFSNWLKLAGTYLGVMGDKGNSALGTIGSLLSVASGYLTNFAKGFKGVSDILTKGDFAGASDTFGFAEDSKVVDVLYKVRDAFVGTKTAADDLQTSIGGVTGRFTAVGQVGGEVESVWTRIGTAFSSVAKFLSPAISAMGEFFSWLGTQVKRVIQDLSGQDMLALVNTGVFIAAYLSVKKFFDNFADLFSSASGTFNRMSEVFDTLTEHVTAMTNNIKADTLLKIALAIGVLAASVWVLSHIEVKDLTAATIAIVTLMKSVMMTMESLAASVNPATTAKIYALGATLVLLSVSILVLSAALKVFASMDLGELAKGVVTLAIVLKILSSALDAMPEKDLVRTAISLGILAGALLLFSVAILAFSAMDVGTVAEGLAYLAATLVVMSVAMKALPVSSMIKNAVALGILAVSLQLLAVAILSFSAMDWGTFIKGIAMIGASLLVLGIGMALMTEALPGAAAMLVVSASLLILATALKIIGGLSWGDLAKGLAVIVVSIVVFAAAALALTPVLPILAAFALVLLALGVAMAAAGAGMFLFASGFALLAVSGAAGAVGFTAALMAILEILPLFAQQLGLAVLAFAVVISEGGPAIVAALYTVLVSLLEAINKAIPKFIEVVVTLLMGFLQAVQIVAPEYIKTVTVLIMAVVNAIVTLVPFLVDAGLRLLLGIIKGFQDNVPKIIAAGKDLVIKIIEGVGQAALDIANAGADTLVKFLNGLADAIRTHSTEINKAGKNIAGAVIDGITLGLREGVNAVWNGAKAMIEKIPLAIRKFLGIASPSKVTTKLAEYAGQGVVNGLYNMGKAVYNAAAGTGDQAVKGLQKGLKKTDSMSASLDVNPVITPVLDLTEVEAGAQKINDLLSTQTISVETAANSANGISRATRASSPGSVQDEIDGAQGSKLGTITFVQNNNSPKALSEAEIYRQTQNQLSVVKGGLPG